MRKSLIRIWSICWYNFLPIMRNPLTFLTIVIWPVIPMLFMGLFLGEEGVKQGLVGVIITSVSFSGIYVAQDYVFNRTITKLQDFFVASPVKEIEYIIGISLSSLLTTIISIVIGYILLIYLGVASILSLVYFTIIVLAGALTLLPLGFLIGSRFNDAARVNGLTNILSIVFSFIAPVYYPLDYIPESYRTLTYLIPTTHIAHLSRLVLGLTNIEGLGIFNHVIILLITSIVFYVLGMRYSRWREI